MILVGEMRDLETISTALTAAETGHLVLGTLHTQSAAEHDRPHHRRLPGRAAGAGPHPARRRAPGRRHADAASDRRRHGPRRRARDPAPRRRRPEPGPPGEGRADLLRHADRARRAACRRWSSRCRARLAAHRSPTRPRSRVHEQSGAADRPARARRVRDSRTGRRRAVARSRRALAGGLRVAGS